MFYNRSMFRGAKFNKAKSNKIFFKKYFALICFAKKCTNIVYNLIKFKIIIKTYY